MYKENGDSNWEWPDIIALRQVEQTHLHSHDIPGVRDMVHRLPPGPEVRASWGLLVEGAKGVCQYGCLPRRRNLSIFTAWVPRYCQSCSSFMSSFSGCILVMIFVGDPCCPFLLEKLILSDPSPGRGHPLNLSKILESKTRKSRVWTPFGWGTEPGGWRRKMSGKEEEANQALGCCLGQHRALSSFWAWKCLLFRYPLSSKPRFH